MTRISGWLLGALLLLLAGRAAASGLVIADDVPLERMRIGPEVLVYTGDQQPGDIHAASLLPDEAFARVGSKSPMQLMQTSWYRYSIHNATTKPRSFVLDFDQALYNRIEWLARNGSASRELVTGQSYPYDSRDIHYNYFAFRLDVPPGETVKVDFSIYTPFAASFVPLLSDSEKFTEHLPQVWQFSGSVVGMLYAVALFLLIYIVRMPKLGAAHAMLGQIFFSTLSVLYLGGIVQRWLPDLANWRYVTYVLIHAGQGVCYCLAVRSFFQAPTNYPWLGRALLALAAAAAVLIVLSLLLSQPLSLDYLEVATLTINFLMMVVSVSIAIISLAQQQKGTALFAVGLILFVLMTATSVLGSAGVLPASFLTRYSYELALTLQADFLFLAIATRIFSMEKDRLNMQTEMLQMNADMKARSEFVDRVTHDIKSPLSAVLGAVQLLSEKTSGQDVDTYLGVIRHSSSAVIGIVDDILSHSRMKANQMTLNSKPFNFLDLLADLETSIRVSEQHKQLVFSMVVGRDIPAVVEGDKLRLSQLLINLLTNAFKFTDEGRVNLRVDLVEKRGNRILVRFIVQDTGIGMSEAFLQQAFEPYAREESLTGYRPGFGLGLSICKQIVELMGGTIDVLSAAGQGSRFTVVLPFVVPE